MKPPLTIDWLLFDELSLSKLYEILQLRSTVFVLEQACIYLDPDGVDQKSHHGLVYDNKDLIGYIRVYLNNTKDYRFGRLVVSKAYRKQKIGKLLITSALEKISQLNNKATITISAQAHLEGYYKTYGFKSISKPYDDHGIMHIDMQLKPGSLV